MKGVTIYLTANQNLIQNAKEDHKARPRNKLPDPIKVLEKPLETDVSPDSSFDSSALPMKKENLITLIGNAPKDLNFVLFVTDDQKKNNPKHGLNQGNSFTQNMESGQMKELTKDFRGNSDKRIRKPRKFKNKRSKKLGLTETEVEILRLICDENTSKEIAEKVCLGRRTIEHYRRRILIKTDSQSPIGLVKFAIKNGLY